MAAWPAPDPPGAEDSAPDEGEEADADVDRVVNDEEVVDDERPADERPRPLRLEVPERREAADPV